MDSPANELLADVRKRLTSLAAGDPLLLFAYRRKVIKKLSYDERGKPVARAKLKAMKWGLQNRRCAHCGVTEENTELVHAKCHQKRQAAKRYS